MNTFGRHFRVTTWGESHGEALGAVIDGCPAGVRLDTSMIQPALDRRRPGQSAIVTPRNEQDRVRILSGVFDGRTTGTPISLAIDNADVDSSKYEDLKNIYRPSHADFTYEARYGERDWRGGGRASARETAARVAAGAVAELTLPASVEIVAWVSDVGDIASSVDHATVSRTMVDANDVRCPDPRAADLMLNRIASVRGEKDSLGGCVRCVIRGLAAGLGDPVFGKVDAALAGAMLSVPAAKGFEIGSGFAGTRMKGSDHNDPLELRDGVVRTLSNHSGGVLGGITNGEAICFRVAFKPVATIFRPQRTLTRAGEAVVLEARGRHDPCVLPRAVPIVEAMAALVLADVLSAKRAQPAGPPTE